MTLELQQSLKRTGHFRLFNCLVLGSSKYSGVQRLYSDPFPKKLFHGRNRQDLALLRPPGIDPGGFTLTPDSVYYCKILLLFSFSSMTDTGSKSFDCALVSLLELYEGPLAGGKYLIICNFVNYCPYCDYCNYCTYCDYFN